MANDNFSYRLRAFFTYIRFKLRLPKDKENMQLTLQSVRSGATMSGVNLWVLVTAIFTASLGLNVNSTAVIIGAMLISPLMGPIVAIGTGVAIQDFVLVYRALKNFGIAVFLSVLTSTLYFFISPLKVPGSELLARTSPTIYDVLIAIVGGIAGILAGSSKLRQSNVVPGVAIATALMPPLCTVGFGLANLNFSYVFGAFYLFFINTVFISLSTYFIVRLLKYPAVSAIQSRRAKQIQRTIWVVVIITLLPSILLTYQIVRKYVLEERAKAFVQKEFSDRNRIVLRTNTAFKESKPVITLTLLGAVLDSAAKADLQVRLAAYGLGNATLDINQDLGEVMQEGLLSSSIAKSTASNTQALKGLYQELDAMKQHYRLPLIDTLQLSLGRELGLLLPGLESMSLEPVHFYDNKLAANRKGWQVDLQLRPRPARPMADSVALWLKAKLPGDTIILNLK